MSILSTLFSKKEDLNNLDSIAFEKIINEDKKAVLLDVRTQQENSQVRIPKSFLIDFYKPNFLQAIQKLEKSKTYLVYCHSGRRSYSAYKRMQQLGFTNVYNLKNGISGWQGKVERG